MIALIVAVAKGNVIGCKGKMPWGHLPNDLLRFKTRTMGHHLVMGSKTYDSIGKVLPGRQVIVLTRDFKGIKSQKGCTVIQSLDPVFDLAKRTCVYVAGGESVYRQFIDKADIAYVTRINAEFEGDTFFPELRTPEWSNLNSVDEIDAGYRVSFELWARGARRGQLITPTPSDTSRIEIVSGYH